MVLEAAGHPSRGGHPVFGCHGSRWAAKPCDSDAAGNRAIDRHNVVCAGTEKIDSQRAILQNITEKSQNGLERYRFRLFLCILSKKVGQKIGVDEILIVVYNTNVIRFNIYVTYRN